MIAMADKQHENAHPKKEAFLAAYAKLGSVSAAAKAAKICRRVHYAWLDDDPDYPERFAEAHQEACEGLEDEARRRATRKKKPSDLLLICLLRANMPHKYREKYEPTDEEIRRAVAGRMDRIAKRQSAGAITGPTTPAGNGNGGVG